ncbi:hypothetical protein DFQ28_008536 [Apophysomyces sp. BC1034]|nr:hypothetical protein DFQ28_008536 [Apophysomyces sp. BC1034]
MEKQLQEIPDSADIIVSSNIQLANTQRILETVLIIFALFLVIVLFGWLTCVRRRKQEQDVEMVLPCYSYEPALILPPSTARRVTEKRKRVICKRIDNKKCLVSTNHAPPYDDEKAMPPPYFSLPIYRSPSPPVYQPRSWPRHSVIALYAQPGSHHRFLFRKKSPWQIASWMVAPKQRTPFIGLTRNGKQVKASSEEEKQKQSRTFL